MIKKKQFRKIIPYFITILFIALILFFSRNQWGQFNKVSEISLKTIVLLSVFFLLTQIAEGYMLKIIVEVFDIKLKILEWFGLSSLRAFGNYLPLNAGVVSNSVYLKYQKGLPITKFMSFIIGQTIIMILTYGILGIIILFIRYAMNYDFNLIMFITSSVFVLFGIVVITLPKHKINSTNRILGWIKSVNNGWDLIKAQKILVFKIIIFQTIILIINSLRYITVFNEMGYKIDILAIIILTIMISVIRFTSVLPGNLGVNEAISGGAMKTFGLMFTSGVLVTIVIRIISMFWIFLLGIIFSFVLLKKKKENMEKQI